MKRKVIFGSVTLLSCVLLFLKCRSTSETENNLCDTQKDTVCTMQFAPAQCTYGTESQGIVSKGSNSCNARKNMLDALCARYKFVNEDMLRQISCVANP